MIHVELSKFASGEARVLLYNVNRKFEYQPSFRDWYGANNKRKCAHFLLDLGKDFLELEKLASLTIHCGQNDDVLYHVVSSSLDLQSERLRMKQMHKYFADRGANVIVSLTTLKKQDLYFVKVE